MGIREEIEHLRNCHLRALRRIDALCERCQFHDEFGCLLPKTKGRDYIAYHFTAGQTLGEALSILDEWELVGEQTLRSGRDIIYFRTLKLTDNMAFEVGDHISIYVRRGHEDKLD